MVNRICQCCQYSTPSKFNFEKHLQTKKHLKKMSQMTKNEEKMRKNEEKMRKNEEKSSDFKSNQNQKTLLFDSQLNCQFCQKMFSRSDNLKRHISVCKLNICSLKDLKDPKGSKNEEKSSDFTCQYCQNGYQTKRGLNRHVSKCQVLKHKIQNLENDLQHQQQTIEIVSKMKPSQITNNITNNKTINYLNSNFGEMIEMEKFLYNLQHTEQLTHREREMLLMAYKDNGIELFARSFSHIMKENCRRQLLKEGLPDFPMLPLYCSDGNLRSHKEKDSKGWKTHYDNQSINTMINISSDQVYQTHHHPSCYAAVLPVPALWPMIT